MSEEDADSIGVGLRNKLFSVLKDFWLENQNLPKKDVFVINSVVIA